jgi:hypothetical protein
MKCRTIIVWTYLLTLGVPLLAQDGTHTFTASGGCGAVDSSGVSTTQTTYFSSEGYAWTSPAKVAYLTGFNPLDTPQQVWVAIDPDVNPFGQGVGISTSVTLAPHSRGVLTRWLNIDQSVNDWLVRNGIKLPSNFAVEVTFAAFGVAKLAEWDAGYTHAEYPPLRQGCHVPILANPYGS